MEEDIKRIENLIKKCDDCNLKECIQCNISWSEIQSIKEFYKSYKILKEENEELKMKIQFINKNNIDDLYEKALEKTMTKFLNDNIERDFIPVSKIKEIVDECIPRGKNIITGVEEYQPNANANSYLAQEILKLLERK